MFIQLKIIKEFSEASGAYSETKNEKVKQQDHEAETTVGMYKFSEIFSFEAEYVDVADESTFPPDNVIWHVQFNNGQRIKTRDDVVRILMKAKAIIAEDYDGPA